MKTRAARKSDKCSGGVQGRIGPEPPSTATLTVWGCKPGSGTVELRNISGNTLLASVTITVKNPPPTSTPPAVSDLTATASTTSVRLSWDDLDGATKYRVEHRLSTSTGAWTPVDTTASGHTVTSLAPGTSYAFKVRAYGDGTKYKAEWGAEASTTVSTVALVVPPAVSNLTATASTTSVRLGWDDLDGAAKYRVEHRLSTSTASRTPVDTTASAHTVASLAPGTSYAFKVRAYGDGAKYKAAWGVEAATTVSTVALVSPPAPGGLSASASGASSVSVSWTALAGADKYAVRYRQGSSGNWDTDEDDITGASHRVHDLDCDTGYQFSVRAYGDGATYLAAWGAWSSASSEVRTSTCPTATPTPTPTPTPKPSGQLGASPGRIIVGQTTTITASWKNVTSTPKLTYGPQLAERCAGTQGQGVQGQSVESTEVVAKATQTLMGCADAIVTVQLRAASDNTLLDTIEVTVLPLPRITGASRIGYRYFTIEFSSYSDYRRNLTVEWRNKADTTSSFIPLATVDAPGETVPRGIVNSLATGAVVRGIPYGSGGDLEVRVVGTTPDNLRGASAAYTVPRGSQPAAIGHLPDHVMMYDLSGLAPEVLPLARYLETGSASSAGVWAAVVTSLESCVGTVATVETVCSQNADKSVVEILLGEQCGRAIACYIGSAGSIDGKLDGTRKIIFTPHTGYVWTDNKDLDREVVTGPDGRRRVHKWYENVLVHEFGHAFGVVDRYERFSSGRANPHYDPNYIGIMKGTGTRKGDKSLSPHDRSQLEKIYETHIKGRGW